MESPVHLTLRLSHLSPLALFVSLAAMTPADAQSAPLKYPETRKVDHVDTYNGIRVPDPFRWLEDDTSSATKAWVEAQNKVTFGYLAEIPYRDRLKNRLTELLNYERISAPSKRKNWYLYFKNDGLQNQSVIYVQRGLNGTPEVLLDPNKMSADGPTRVGALV